jgi:hypothetical protein
VFKSVIPGLVWLALSAPALCQPAYVSHETVLGLPVAGVHLDMEADAAHQRLLEDGWQDGFATGTPPELAGGFETMTPIWERDGAELSVYRFRDPDGVMRVSRVELVDPAEPGRSLDAAVEAIRAAYGPPVTQTELGSPANPSIRMRWSTGPQLVVSGRNAPEAVQVYEACGLEAVGGTGPEGCPTNPQDRARMRMLRALIQFPMMLEVRVSADQTLYTLDGLSLYMAIDTAQAQSLAEMAEAAP